MWLAIVLAAAGCAATLPADKAAVTRTPTPSRDQPMGPQARAGHVLTYDAAGQRVLLFGGYAGPTLHRDIWQMREGQWSQLAPAAPFAPRVWQSIVFDPIRKNYVMFGGKTSDRVPFGDTWLWDGRRWSEVEGDGPPPRSHHTSVFDPHRGVVVLFGGDGGEVRLLNDTWEWTGTAWQKMEATGPSPRAAHMSAYDPARRMVIVAGGVAPDNKTRLQDTWGWDGSSWTRLADLPRPCALGSAVGTSDGMLIFGGWSDGFTPHQDTWRLDSQGWRAVEGSRPPARSGAALVFLPDRGASILAGGIDGQFDALADAWFFNGQNWVTKPAMFFGSR